MERYREYKSAEMPRDFLKGSYPDKKTKIQFLDQRKWISVWNIYIGIDSNDSSFCILANSLSIYRFAPLRLKCTMYCLFLISYKRKFITMVRFTKKCLCLYSIYTKQIVMEVHSVYLMLHQGRLYVVPFTTESFDSSLFLNAMLLPEFT